MQKKWSLVLWWWAARWFVHIWVLRWMEECGIYPDEIIWTSMWSVVWWLIALWFSSSQMSDMAKDIKLKHMIDFSIKNWWVFGYKKIEKLLQNIFWQHKIEDLNTKLKIITTDIKTWKKIVLEDWVLRKAIRWSISIPFLFSPFVYDDYLLIDGGIISNLSLEDSSFDNILAVSCLAPIDNMQSWYKKKIKKAKMMKNVLHCMFTNNQKISILDVEKKNKNTIILRPEIKNSTFGFGKKIDESIMCGYDEFMKNKDKIINIIK